MFIYKTSDQLFLETNCIYCIVQSKAFSRGNILQIATIQNFKGVGLLQVINTYHFDQAANFKRALFQNLLMCKIHNYSPPLP